MRLLLRRIIAVVALAAGLGLGAGTAVASAATPATHAGSSAQHQIRPTIDDWWW